MAFRVVTSAALASVVAGGACTSDEEAALNNAQKVAGAAKKCSDIIYPGINFNDCFAEELGLSKACAGCYAVAEEYNAENCKADCLLGWCKAGCLACNAPAQEDLATCTGFTPPTTDPCEESLEEEVTSAVLVSVVAGGACTSDEEAALNNAEKFAEAAKKCTDIITGVVFNDCFAKELGLSKACAGCYAVAEEYSAENCKVDCLLGWCKAGCLACNAPAQEDLATCTGFTPPTTDPCEESLEEELTSAALVSVVAGGACTSDEEAALNNAEKVAEAARKCRNPIYPGVSFNDCFAKELGLSKACAGCYAVAEEYSAENCKADCLLGWCKAGCLACNAPAQEDLATCTGFTPPTTDPCEEMAIV